MSEAAALMRLARETLNIEALSSEMRLRAAAILARQALEDAIASALRSEGAEPSRMSFRVQLETLRHLRALPGERSTRIASGSADAAFAWAALSRATHYHGYELPPTRAALLDWMDLAETAVRVLGTAGPAEPETPRPSMPRETT